MINNKLNNMKTTSKYIVSILFRNDVILL